MSDRLIGVVPEVYIARDREFTIAFGIYVDEKLGVVPFAGATKRNPADHENKARGERLAVGNAFRHLGRKLLKAEYDAIHQQFHTKEKKKKKVEEPCSCEDCCDETFTEVNEDDYSWGYTDGYHQAMEDMRE